MFVAHAQVSFIEGSEMGSRDSGEYTDAQGGIEPF